MRKKKVLVLMHADLVPPDDIAGKPDAEVLEYKTEYDVVTGLRDLGHAVQPLGLYDDLTPLRAAIQNFKPHIVFNLLEEFRGEPMLDQNVVSYLELIHSLHRLQSPWPDDRPRQGALEEDPALPPHPRSALRRGPGRPQAQAQAPPARLPANRQVAG
jgi:D-alanine-D-alanine ligase